MCAQQLWFPSSRAQAQWWRRTGWVASWHVGSSQTTMKPVSPTLAPPAKSTAGVSKHQTLHLPMPRQTKCGTTPTDFPVQTLNLNLVKPPKQRLLTGGNVWRHLWFTLGVERVRSAPGKKWGSQGCCQTPTTWGYLREPEELKLKTPPLR